LVFLKFHQVGGGAVLAFIDALLKLFVHNQKRYPALRELAGNRAESVIIDHVASYNQVRKWIDNGYHKPHDTCAFVILREPQDRMIDTFCKKWFTTDKNIGNEHQMDKNQGHNWNLNMALGLHVGQKRKWKYTFHTKAIEQYWADPDPSHRPESLDGERYSEYSVKLGKRSAAHKLLSQFNVVGVTEEHDDFLNRICLALGVTWNDCAAAKETAAADTEHAHVYPEHPTMKDFTSGFKEMVKDGLASDIDIYESARKMSGSGHDGAKAAFDDEAAKAAAAEEKQKEKEEAAEEKEKEKEQAAAEKEKEKEEEEEEAKEKQKEKKKEAKQKEKEKAKAEKEKDNDDKDGAKDKAGKEEDKAGKEKKAHKEKNKGDKHESKGKGGVLSWLGSERLEAQR